MGERAKRNNQDWDFLFWEINLEYWVHKTQLSHYVSVIRSVELCNLLGKQGNDVIYMYIYIDLVFLFTRVQLL